MPPPRFDFVIVCALQEEADAYAAAGYPVGKQKVLSGLACRELDIAGQRGVIVTPPRMGLVSCAIISSQAIERFKPRLICMSGICGGVRDKANVYDVIIPEVCHQNDSGKWTATGFEPEIYSVQLDHSLRLKLGEILSSPGFIRSIRDGVALSRSEFPDNVEKFDFDIFLAPTSSGSSVVARDEMVQSIAGQHRKLSAFEMESFAVYEAARLSAEKPLYFSAKSVVDDGGAGKGDRFHRVACLLSAKVVYECIRSGLIAR
jgi:nucleoside phosphorylase